jgi:hypothetical protein
MSDSTTPQDSAAMPPASAGSVANSQATLDRWIPVTERLPDIGQHVAALTAGGRRFVGYTATLYSRHCWIDRGNEVAVTHWVPLPALPTEDK